MKLIRAIKTCLNLIIECQIKWPNFDVGNQKKLKKNVERFYNDSFFQEFSNIVVNNISSAVLYNYLNSIECVTEIGCENESVQFIAIRDTSDQNIRFDYHYDNERYRISNIRMKCSVCFGDEFDVDECEVCDATGWF